MVHIEYLLLTFSTATCVPWSRQDMYLPPLSQDVKGKAEKKEVAYAWTDGGS